MASWLQHRACSLVVILALVAGTTAIPPTTPRCHCPPQCPMHAHGLTCHHTAGRSCHQMGCGIRATCDHAADAGAPVSSVRALLPPQDDARPRLARALLLTPPVAAKPQPFLEPPTHPPRLHVT